MKQYQPPTAAALYARVSSERQDVDLSVAGQLRALRDYAKNNGYTVARESAHSGTARAIPQPTHGGHSTENPCSRS